MIDHYATLGISPDATPDEVRTAAKRAAAKTHPDRGGTVEAFRAAREAWDTLKDPAKRAAYDRERERAQAVVQWPTETSVIDRFKAAFDFRFMPEPQEKP